MAMSDLIYLTPRLQEHVSTDVTAMHGHAVHAQSHKPHPHCLHLRTLWIELKQVLKAWIPPHSAGYQRGEVTLYRNGPKLLSDPTPLGP